MTTSPLIFIVLLLPLISTTSREPILCDDAAIGPNTTCRATPVEAAEDLIASGSPTSPKTANRVVTKNIIHIIIRTAAKLSIANRHNTSGQTATTVSTRAADIEERLNRYCELARLEPSQSGYTSEKCCDDRGKCENSIGPGETKYGLTNPDPTWPRRLCSCDQMLYNCVMGGKNNFAKDWSMMHAFRHMKCFRRIPCPGACSRIRFAVEYEFVPLLDTLR